jgi:DNA-binding NarL/FixJ family response regulator
MDLSSQENHQHIRILLADSNQTQSEVLSSALRRHPSFKVACCRSELSECLRVQESTAIDVVLFAENASFAHRRDTLTVIRGLHTAYPNLGVILLHETDDRELVVNAIRSGARGLFCLTQQPFKSLCKCITSVHKGQIWANTQQLRYVVDALSMNPLLHVVDANGNAVLTAREEQVVSLVAEGTSNRGVAEQLRIKENTVKKSLFRIYDKVGVSNRVELVLYALTHRNGTHAVQ